MDRRDVRYAHVPVVLEKLSNAQSIELGPKLDIEHDEEEGLECVNVESEKNGVEHGHKVEEVDGVAAERKKKWIGKSRQTNKQTNKKDKRIVLTGESQS